ncbi:MAG TPA: chorismate mutase [Candidatus Avamphibacillus intestinigallinarum]|nr:chorismate mutase [Candidatus Avamphibacillus intestinigallinarum]
MIRGVRGATTVKENKDIHILNETETLVQEMIKQNKLKPENVSHAIITTTPDLTATFPAKVIRSVDGWKHVPVMCMSEIDVPNALEQCIRIMMVVNTDQDQQEVQHIFLNEAVKLRPDLVKGE